MRGIALQRLAGCLADDPSQHKLLFGIVREEVSAGGHQAASSATKGLLWLSRFLHFVVVLVRTLQEDTLCTLYSAASAAYSVCLQPYHGFIATAAFTVCERPVPSFFTHTYRSTYMYDFEEDGVVPAAPSQAFQQPRARNLRCVQTGLLTTCRMTGFMVRTARVQVVLNLCPARTTFEEALGGNSGDGGTFLLEFSPIIELIQTFLVRSQTLAAPPPRIRGCHYW
jgi:hypothetical protein